MSHSLGNGLGVETRRALTLEVTLSSFALFFKADLSHQAGLICKEKLGEKYQARGKWG